MKCIQVFSCFLSAQAAAFLAPTLPIQSLITRNTGWMSYVGNQWISSSVSLDVVPKSNHGSILEFEKERTAKILPAPQEIETATTVKERRREELRRKSKRLQGSANQALIVSLIVFSLMVSPAMAKGGGGRSSGGRSSSSSRPSMSRSSTYRRSSPSSSRSSSSTSYQSTKRNSGSSSSKRNSGSSSSSSGSSSSSSPKSASRSPPKVYSTKPSASSSPSLKPSSTATSKPAQTSTSQTSTSQTKATRPTPPKTKRRSMGRMGGRVQRGKRSQDKPSTPSPPKVTHSPSKQTASQTNMFWSSSPRRRSTVHRQDYRYAKPRTYTTVIQEEVVVVQEPPAQEVVVLQDRALKPQPFYPADPATLPATGGVQTLPLSATARTNPWPARVLWAGSGWFVTTAWYETQKSHPRNDSRVLDAKAARTKDDVDRRRSTIIGPFQYSGLYTGVTEESDGTVQEVETFLEFSTNGKVEGFGFDEEDGPYRVQGTWRGDTAKWTEKYEDYSVRVKCKCRESTILDCTFVSSIDNIKGAFELKKKHY